MKHDVIDVFLQDFAPEPDVEFLSFGLYRQYREKRDAKKPINDRLFQIMPYAAAFLQSPGAEPRRPSPGLRWLSLASACRNRYRMLSVLRCLSCRVAHMPGNNTDSFPTLLVVRSGIGSIRSGQRMILKPALKFLIHDRSSPLKKN